MPTQSIPKVPESFRREISFVEHSNPSVTRYSPSNWTSFLAVSGGCSCGFYHAETSSANDTSKMIAKYRKKGWTESKIQRVLSNRPTTPVRQVGLRDDILNLISILVRDQKHLRLSLHWYSGSTEDERFTLNDLGAISLSNFMADTSVFRDESTLTINQG